MRLFLLIIFALLSAEAFMKPATTYSHTRNPHSSSKLMSASEMDFSATQGKPIKCKAMVARGVNDMKEEEITVDVPKSGEVRVKVRI